MKRILAILATVSMMVSIGSLVAFAEDNVFKSVGNDASEAGKQIGKAGKDVGKEIGKTGKEVGKGIADSAKDVGKAFSGK
jgi:hypothetical protein